MQKNSYKQKNFFVTNKHFILFNIKNTKHRDIILMFQNRLLFGKKLFIKLILFKTNKIRNINLFQFYHFRQTFF